MEENNRCFLWYLIAVELHLSGLIGKANYPDMQKIRIVGFFFKNRLHWRFEVRLLKFSETCV